MHLVWSVREAHIPEDLDLVRQLFREYEQAIGVDLCFQDFEAELASLPGAYARPQGVLLLAFLDRKPVGCAALKPLANSRACELKRLYVRPEGRGRGIGLGLVRRVLREAKRQGYDTIRLDTLARMETALKLYRQLGFREIKPYYANSLPDSIFMEHVL